MRVGNPPHYNSAEDLQKAVDAYFQNPINYKVRVTDEGEEKIPIYTVCGLAYSLGFVSRQTVYDYINRKPVPSATKEENEMILELSYILSKAIFFIESEYEAKLQSNNVAGIIFALKNMGWKDRSEIEETHRFQQMPKITVNGEELKLKLGD